MARKRQEGITTDPRYTMKAFSVGMGIGSGNVKMAEAYAEALRQARAMGVAIYKGAWQVVRALLIRLEVPSLQWAQYKAFTNELISKVQKRGIMTVDQLREKYETLGSDSTVLDAIVNKLGEVVTEGAPTSAVKGA